MAFELFKLTAGINLAHIAFDGGAAALLAVVNGDTQAMMAPTLAVMPMIKDGRLRALAVSGRTPDPAAPELPTIAATLPGYSATSWFAILGPAGTPAGVDQPAQHRARPHRPRGGDKGALCGDRRRADRRPALDPRLADP